MNPDRLSWLRKEPVNDKGRYVLYWMQADQRVDDNPALAWALQKANEKSLPLVVLATVWEKYPEANARHFAFFLDGLQDNAEQLARRGIRFLVLKAPPTEAVAAASQAARLVVCDRGYLPHQRAWRRQVAENAPCPVAEVEGGVVVPVEAAYPKEAWSAAVLRPRIHRLLEFFLSDVDPVPDAKLPEYDGDFPQPLSSFPALNPKLGRGLLKELELDLSVEPVEMVGGTQAALERFNHWLDAELAGYDTARNDPNTDAQSGMSPYLHFGHISARYLANEALKRGGEGAAAFVEELVVRRELSMNFVWYNPGFHRWDALPDWAKRTMDAHRADEREYVYTREQWENAATHDPAWNACQTEMVRTGKMHGYLRMYWGKKLIEWSATPEEAWDTALYLNNKYELDGRDPNGYAGVAWCFGKHDRPWTERSVFGTLRFMNFTGLKRKMDIMAYIRRFFTENQK